MTIVVLGATGRVGSRLSDRLERSGYDVRGASRRTGVDAVTGAGLDQALQGARVVVDVTNAPAFDEETATRYFEASTANLLDASRSAGVLHYVALSIVGAERLEATGYFRAKLAQERLVIASGLPHTILRSTQFFEFLDAIAQDGDEGDQVRVAAARVQPIAADDTAGALADIAVHRPVCGVAEVAGPDGYSLAELVRRVLAAHGDSRPVIADPEAPYFGAPLANETLLAGNNPRFGATDFDTWLRRQPA